MEILKIIATVGYVLVFGSLIVGGYMLQQRKYSYRKEWERKHKRR